MYHEPTVPCPLCNSTAPLKEAAETGYQRPATFQIYLCPNCNTSFALPHVPTARLYETIYRKGHSVPGYNRYWKYAEDVKNEKTPLAYLSKAEEAYWGVSEALEKFVLQKATSKILEVGSGLGYLTYALSKEGYNINGLDISETAVEYANANFGNHYILADLFEYAKKYEATYDIVILTEVIEHVEQPISFLEAIIKLLKPGGRAIVTTPNRTLFGDTAVWYTELPPIHYWWFSEQSMKVIGEKMGVRTELIDYSKFYRKNYRAIDIQPFRDGKLKEPVLDENGELLQEIQVQSSPVKEGLLSFINAVPPAAALYKKLKKATAPGILICTDRGSILCAVFQKQDSRAV